MSNATPAIRIRDLHTWYGESHILHGIDLQVNRGEVVTLLGRNGSGRTTTLKAIMGLVGRRSGSIMINGREAKAMAPHRIAHFVHELAGMFHTFYNHCRIIQEDKDLERARLALVTAVRITIANSLAILGVSAPEKM